MPETRIICVGPQMRSILLEHAASKVEHMVISQLPECPAPTEIQIVTGKRSRGERREKGEKRAPSAYNTFIGQCMKNAHIKGFENAAPQMKKCAAEWKAHH